MSESLYPHMVQEYYVARLRALSLARAEQRAKVRTKEDVLRLRRSVRRRLRACFGPRPRKTPLNAATLGTVRRPEYVIEKVIYESRPGFKVTGNLYVPSGGGPFPVVLGPCGHSQNGKAYGDYQAFATGLARRGYMALVYDPLSQGERVQISRRIGSFRPGNCCHEHNMFGNRLALLGDFFGMWRAWDGIRGLDYLLSRPEADRAHVGVTGSSGGGTLTTYVSALDDRVTMAAPSCFVTTFLCNLENELPADSEQTPPGMLAAGLELADFFVAQIPRPVLFLGQQNDFFDVRGLRETYEELRRLYGIIGAQDNVQLSIGSGGHGFYADSRDAMYRFFARHSGRPVAVKPSESRPEKEQTLWAAPGGSVLKAGSRNMALLLKDAAERVEQHRRPLAERELKQAIAQVLALPERKGAPHYRVLRSRPSQVAGLPGHSMFSVETEPGIQAILHLYGRETWAYLPRRKQATVYVPHLSSEDDARDGLAPKGREVFAVDVRGMGLTMALTCGDPEFFAPYGSDYMYAMHGQMLSEPYVGKRVHDLLRVLDLLRDGGCRAITLAGRGMGSLLATFAGCLHPAVKRVHLINAPSSYGEMMRWPVVEWPRSAMAWGLLGRFDLPDCYRLLRRKKGLRMTAPWDHLMRAGKRARRTAGQDRGRV